MSIRARRGVELAMLLAAAALFSACRKFNFTTECSETSETRSNGKESSEIKRKEC